MVHTLKFKASVDHQFAKRYFMEDPLEYFNSCLTEGITGGNIKLRSFEDRPNKWNVKYEALPRILPPGYNYIVTYTIDVDDTGLWGDGNYVTAVLAFFQPYTLLEHTILPRNFYDNLTLKPFKERNDYPMHKSISIKYTYKVYQRVGKGIKVIDNTSAQPCWEDIEYNQLPEDLKGAPEFQELKTINNAPNILKQGPNSTP